MKPPFELTAKLLNQLEHIHQKLGEIKALHLVKPSPQLRKKNRIKTVLGSLAIEGNKLSESQVTAVLENKRVIGAQNEITEVLNALAVYQNIHSFKPNSLDSFLSAHHTLMNKLVADPGKFRTGGVGVVKGSKVAHLAPPAALVKGQMRSLFSYLSKSEDPVLIKSCVFHYETEFIHPFSDGNGRMGRFWQTVILAHTYPVFEFVPVESIIFEHQKEYYKALSKSDKMGHSTPFIEFMLGVIDETLHGLLVEKKVSLSAIDRLQLFIEEGLPVFNRKVYMQYFKTLSTATASRDLLSGVELGLLQKTGDKSKTIYKVVNTKNKI